MTEQLPMTPQEYRIEYSKSVHKMQIALVEAMKSAFNPKLTPTDEINCAVIAITTLSMDLTECINQGNEKEFTFDDFLHVLADTKLYLEKKIENKSLINSVPSEKQ